MSRFHFFIKGDTKTHLDIDSKAYGEEKDQLLSQGFERIGGTIHAENSCEAYEKHESELRSELSYLVGGNNLLRFAKGLNSLMRKRNQK
ncbi:hypothetical protein MACH09_29400 [Vibrio sp. MACH09]|uniref:hypothetical protein n=1 Tax=Vibrio sp. MACH09 TaxID=3025122 RepID=UPI002791F0B5|nr:hypothetical protein [Vibrio sp. MACH09]GLO62432.1 hypothetical protein MACH09_29400 [Vibrio sp. MACH09]